MIIIIIIKDFVVSPGVHRTSFDPDPKAAAILGHKRSEAMERMPLDTLAKALATGKTRSEFNVLDKSNVEWTLTCQSVRMARQPDSWQTISVGNCTGPEDCVL